jgi:uncharacterized surface protein with fasciclin (FAS1) repeats
MKTLLKSFFVGCASVVLFCGASQADSPCQSILDIATATPGLSTLVTAVKDANLVGVLSEGGPITVFAPVNSAFEKIPSADLQALLANPTQLQDVLLAHLVIGSRITEKNLKNRNFDTNFVVMANGSTKRVGESDLGYTFGGAGFVATDIQACNGIIHLIDTVLSP